MLNATGEWVGIVSIFLFGMAYSLVIFEDLIHLKKSKPVVLFGCLMWMCIGIYLLNNPGPDPHHYINELVNEIGQLFFFLLVAMTFINTLTHLNVFACLRAWLTSKNLSYRQLFWATGVMTFCLSPIADNLTSALLMATVVQAVSKDKKFIAPAFANIIIAANAGGAWSPFGDITTLMVWTAGKATTSDFVHLMIPSVVNWIVPAVCMHFFVPKGQPEETKEEVKLRFGARRTIVLGVLTVITAISFHNFLHLPPFLGMMTGLGVLMFAGYLSQKNFVSGVLNDIDDKGVDVFKKIEKVEFDTLFFFFGVLMAVGALQYIGYLTLVGDALYGNLGFTAANIIVGLASAIGDNIPVMYAVLKMDPQMGINQWLLITLTAGVGGSMLSIGSAAGVAVMGVDREGYTFISHLKWVPFIALGYAASIYTWYVLVGPA